MSNAQTVQDAAATEEDRPALNDHLTDAWETPTAARHGAEVADMQRTLGWLALRESIELRIAQVRHQLETRTKPFETVGEYEAKLGEIRGLQSIDPLADGVVLLGKEAEDELRE